MDFSKYGIHFVLPKGAPQSTINAINLSTISPCQVLPGAVKSLFIPSIGSRVEFGKLLGKGSYASVFLSTVITPTSRFEAATKTFHLNSRSDINKANSLVNTIVREILINIAIFETFRIEKKIQCVPEIFYVCIADDELYIIQELLDGDLSDYISHTPSLTVDSYIDIIAQFSACVKNLQDLLGFGHRDIKINNIGFKRIATKTSSFLFPSDHINFTTSNPGIRLYLIDFGFSCLTFNGTQLSADAIFNPRAICYREGRDIAQFLYSLYIHGIHKFPRLISFLDYCLNVRINGIVCSIPKTCEAFGMRTWIDVYAFLNRTDIDYTRTQPTNMLRMIQQYVTSQMLPTGTSDILGSAQTP